MNSERTNYSTNLEIAEYQKALRTIEEFHSRVEKIITDVYHENMDEIVYIYFDGPGRLGFEDGVVHVCYSYGDGYGRETVDIPRYWLNRGFDCVADYKRMQERKARAKKLKAARAKKTKEEQERTEYERLKKKFGDAQ